MMLACGSPTPGNSADCDATAASTRSSLTSTTHHATTADIILKDGGGNPIARGSTTPYSPEQTCGGCHDVATITQGYHFQQGRTNADGTMRVSDAFNPKKPWLLSDGMYGKT
jgi:hypothetical protein